MVRRTINRTDLGWRPVVFASDCGEDGFCPVCAMLGVEVDFADCPCPGPTQEDEHGVAYDYCEIDGVLMARPGTPDPAPADVATATAMEAVTAARSNVPQTVGATVSARRHRAPTRSS